MLRAKGEILIMLAKTRFGIFCTLSADLRTCAGVATLMGVVTISFGVRLKLR